MTNKEIKTKNRRKEDKATITLSIPREVKAFLDGLAIDGYNRSALMVKMIKILSTIYNRYPQIPLPRAIDRLGELVQDGLLLREFTSEDANTGRDK